MKALFMIGVPLLFILLLATIFIKLFNHADNQMEDIKSYVGKKVILDKDTLLITDYSLWNSNYILINGRVVGFEITKKLKTIN